MKRFLAATLAVALVLASPLATQAKADIPAWDWNYCHFQNVDPHKWTVREVHLTIHCALRKWPVDHSTVDYIADRESSMFWHATNPYSGACGVFQHMPNLWPGRVRAFNDTHPRWHLATGCYNARSNVLVAVHMMKVGGLSPWT